MARKYTLSKRAEQQAETRRRIAQAAIDLHSIHGPARTTLSQVAEQAGVQRHTLYAHFPDEKSLALACSGLHLEQDPPPRSAQWAEVEGRGQRLVTALRAIYSWYDRNSSLLAAVLRDAEYHEVTREVSQLRFGPTMADWLATLGDPQDPPRRRAMLALALSFHGWRTLMREGGLAVDDAAETMTAAVLAAA